uniref:Sugar phosphate transporter domain-containing protein n=1 Tax=Chromera velia CCMP2878 TaxID=1169474 RepID=A0A0G4IEF8_9ALVE|eukprot:Cvel_13601.t1-p1 / transcript=Cvel_13601.t1 / gene=Cvel_13601 / organism=Chromera_velia_CCMP2878 / gene_product=Solute carrier family 35 member B1, putative / transcript_product=Solute carrier family 35 member B1, putative / location=Cvel_scaffold936:20224-21126(+) / protein_length=301 / sequence_SO=supercontig / SO=protein_coding / is_pseudo=false
MFLVFAMSTGCALSAFFYNLFIANWDPFKTMDALFQSPKEKKEEGRKMSNKLNWEIVMDFFLISLTYIGAMLCSNYALTQVNYPTQVLVKSAKMVPVVLGGLLLYGKRYPWYDYVAVAVITTCLIVFNLAKKKSRAEAAQTVVGLALIFLSLLCDMFTGPRQDKMNKKYQVGAFEHMMFTNLFAMFPSGIAMLIVEQSQPFQYAARYPEMIQYIFLFAVCNTLGQVFIFQSLTSFGALYLTLITTTRKFFTVFFSVIWFGHKLNITQWVSVVGIFSALFMQSYYAQLAKQRKKDEEKSKRT